VSFIKPFQRKRKQMTTLSKSNYMDHIKIINNSYDIEEVYNSLLEVVFNERQYNYQLTKKTEVLKFISNIYNSDCSNYPENKIKIYQLLKTIKEQKAFQMFSNSDTLRAFERLLKYHYTWIRSPLQWKRVSRNPYRQVESLITHLTCRHKLPQFLYNSWYSNTEVSFNKKTWFIFLAEGNSAKNLPGLYFGWTKKMAHEFMQTPDNLGLKEGVIRAVTKANGGDDRLASYFYIDKILNGIFDTKILTSEFWASFIEYFSKQGMFDYEHISHIADYVYHIKFDRSLNRQPEKPNFDIRKKNLTTLINEADLWTIQLNHLARAAGMARRAGGVDIAKSQLNYLNTSWKPSGWAHGWKYSRKVKIGKSKHELIYEMIELCNGSQLLEEGRTMNHCVYSYVGSCSQGRCRIFSLRERSTKSSVLTIEVRGDVISQIRGKGNRKMDADESILVRDWALNAGCTFSSSC